MSTITHPFVSAKSDGGDATLVRPSDWNAEHVVVGDVPYGFIGAKAQHNTATTVSNNTYTKIALNGTEVFDTDGFHSTSSETQRMTIPAGLTGKYLVIGNIGWTSNSAGFRGFILYKNGALHIQKWLGAANGIQNHDQVVSILDLTAGDYIDLYGYQSSGGNLDTTGGYLEVVKLDAGRVGSGVGASVAEGTSQSIPDATYTGLAFNDADQFDTDGFHDPVTNNTRFTIPVGLGGKYAILGQVAWAANATGERQLAIRKNGSGYSGAVVNVPHATIRLHQQVSATLDLAAGDYVEVMVYQDSGSALGTASNFANRVEIMRIDSAPASHEAPTEAILSANTALGTTAYGNDLMSLTLPAGTYRVDWKVAFTVGGATSIYAVLWDDAEATRYDEDEDGASASGGWRYSGVGGWATITLATATTIKVSASRSSDATATALKDGGNSTSGRLTKLSAQRLK